MKYGWDRYVPNEESFNNVYTSSLYATSQQLRGFPPAFMITAENDPLRDEEGAHARKLKKAGVEVVATRYNGTIHDLILLNAL